MSLFNNAIIGAAGQQGYQISRSVRLRSSASAYFNRTLTTPTNNKIFTISAWVKRGLLSTSANHQILSGYVPATSFDGFFIGGSASTYTDKLVYFDNTAGYLVSTQVFRDPSAWYHMIAAVDTTQATASNRVKLYVNGTQITSFSTTNYPSLNQAVIFNSAVAHTLGSFGYNSTAYFDGYMTEFNFVDGQQLTPSSFGETNSITGVWQPKKYAGTYGTNGFYLNFSDNSNNTAATIGKDYSGNGNNWTPNNISVTAGTTYDSMIDVPTMYADGNSGRGNYCTPSPIDQTGTTMSNGNLTLTFPAGTNYGRCTMSASSGKYYFEVTQTAASTSPGNTQFGVLKLPVTAASAFSSADSWSIYSGLSTYNNNVPLTTGATPTIPFVMQIAVDIDAGKIWFGINNTWVGSGNPSTNTNPRYSNLGSGEFMPYWADGASVETGAASFNFGQQPFTYTPPTGFKALNTQNLPDALVKKGNQHFDVVTSTATVSTGTTVSSLAFSPGLMWRKNRNNVESHYWVDAVRGTGAGGFLVSNSTAAATGYPNSDGTLTFNSNGYTIAETNWAAGEFYFNSRTYVDWHWNAGSSTVTNTNGTTSSQVRANPTAGFSVVTFAGHTSGTITVGHGLGAVPKMMIIRSHNNISAWYTYHVSIGANGWLDLSSTGAAVTGNPAAWNNVSPTSTVFTYGSGLINQGNVVAYCFAEVAGYSAFGSYAGNGSADGPFVFTNFQPRWLMVKRTDTAGFDWVIIDTARDPVNVMGNDLYANSSSAEVAGVNRYDFLSNGFKVRTTGNNFNASGGTYIYASFASNPLKLSLAR